MIPFGNWPPNCDNLKRHRILKIDDREDGRTAHMMGDGKPKRRAAHIAVAELFPTVMLLLLLFLRNVREPSSEYVPSVCVCVFVCDSQYTHFEGDERRTAYVWSCGALPSCSVATTVIIHGVAFFLSHFVRFSIRSRCFRTNNSSIWLKAYERESQSASQTMRDVDVVFATRASCHAMCWFVGYIFLR